MHHHHEPHKIIFEHPKKRIRISINHWISIIFINKLANLLDHFYFIFILFVLHIENWCEVFRWEWKKLNKRLSIKSTKLYCLTSLLTETRVVPTWINPECISETAGTVIWLNAIHVMSKSWKRLLDTFRVLL